jgi:transcriptional regulator with XRE-family HTH domain
MKLSKIGEKSLSIASTKRDLLASLKDREFRAAFNLENVYAAICFQLRALREQREMTQGKLGKAAHMAPERISILEDPNAESKPTLNTLLRLAEALDVGLDVRFVPFSTVLARSVHTDMSELRVESFAAELPSLENQVAFELALEGLEVSDIGATHASNNLIVIPRYSEYTAKQASNPLIVPAQEDVATPSPSVPAHIGALGQNIVPPVTRSANAAVA